jgi:hypothetical protein
MKSIAFVSLLLLLGCKSARPVKEQEPASELPPGEVEVEIPCSGPQYYTDENVFRANSVGVSNDLALSKRRAMVNARADLAAAIEVTVGTVTDNYVSSLGLNNSEALSQRFESLTREVVTQRLTGLRVVCERYFMTEAGRYKTYVAIELSAQQLAENYKKRIQADSTLRADFNYDRFREVFEKEMSRTR